jgi:hypothetical protein
VAAEKEAHELLKNTSQQTKDELQNLIRGSGIQGFDLEELIKTLPLYWADKDQRSRYMHDEWYTGIGDEAPVAFAGTRGITADASRHYRRPSRFGFTSVSKETRAACFDRPRAR